MKYILDSLAVGLLCSPALILICTAPLWAYIASIGYLVALCAFVSACSIVWTSKGMWTDVPFKRSKISVIFQNISVTTERYSHYPRFAR